MNSLKTKAQQNQLKIFSPNKALKVQVEKFEHFTSSRLNHLGAVTNTCTAALELLLKFYFFFFTYIIKSFKTLASDNLRNFRIYLTPSGFKDAFCVFWKRNVTWLDVYGVKSVMCGNRIQKCTIKLQKRYMKKILHGVT